MGRARWHKSLISFSAREASVPGGDPRRPRRRDVMESIGCIDGRGVGGVAWACWRMDCWCWCCCVGTGSCELMTGTFVTGGGCDVSGVWSVDCCGVSGEDVGTSDDDTCSLALLLSSSFVEVLLITFVCEVLFDSLPGALAVVLSSDAVIIIESDAGS